MTLPRLMVMALACALGLAACQALGAPGGASLQALEALPTLDASKRLQLGQGPHGLAIAGGFLYTSDTASHQLSVVDLAQDKVVATVPLGEGSTPGSLAPWPQGGGVLGLDTQEGTLFALASEGHRLRWRFPVGRLPDALLLSGDGRQAWISLAGAPQLVQVALPTDPTQAPSVIQRLEIGPLASGDHRALAWSGGWLLSPSSGASLVHAFGPGLPVTGQAIEAKVNPGPVALAGPPGEAPTSALVGLIGSHELLHLRLPSLEVTRLGGVGQGPSDIAVAPDGRRAFVTMSGSNELAVVDMAEARLEARFLVGDRPVHAYFPPPLPPSASQEEGSNGPTGALGGARSGAGTSPPGPELWVSNDRGPFVSVVDAERLQVKLRLRLGLGHRKMAFQGTKAYLTHLSEGSLAIVDRRAW